MDLELAGARVLVTGGSRGIGAAIADAFLQESADVTICARGVEALDATRESLAAAHPERTVRGVVADVGIDAEVEDLVRDLVAAGGLDVVVANATANASGASEQEFADSFRVDLMHPVRIARALRAEQPGHPCSIVCIASIDGMSGATPHHAYSVMKAALLAWTKNAAVAFGGEGMRVNAVAPGAIDFEGGWWDRARASDPDGFAAHVARIPGGRMGRPEEVASVVVFLASVRASWVNGATVLVDGGEHGAAG